MYLTERSGEDETRSNPAHLRWHKSLICAFQLPRLFVECRDRFIFAVEILKCTNQVCSDN